MLSISADAPAARAEFQGRATELGIAPPTTTLNFANEAYTAEMCVLRSMSLGAPLSGGV